MSLTSALKQKNVELEAMLIVERNNEKEAEIRRRIKDAESVVTGDFKRVDICFVHFTCYELFFFAYLVFVVAFYFLFISCFCAISILFTLSYID